MLPSGCQNIAGLLPQPHVMGMPGYPFTTPRPLSFAWCWSGYMAGALSLYVNFGPAGFFAGGVTLAVLTYVFKQHDLSSKAHGACLLPDL